MACNNNNENINDLYDSDFTIDEMELESLLDNLTELASQGDLDINLDDECDIDHLAPIPFDEITPEDGYDALVEFSGPLDLCFASNITPPVEFVDIIRVPPLTSGEVTPSSNQEEKKTMKSKAVTRRQKPRARSVKKTVNKRKMTPTIKKTKDVLSIEMTDFCPETDVLFGRGGHAVHNPGNGFLLDVVKEYRSEYKSLGKTKEGKEKKAIVIQRVVAMVEARGGRFLIRDNTNAPWKQANDQKVHQKIGHMLRD